MNGEERRGVGVAEVEFTNKMTTIYRMQKAYSKKLINREERRGQGVEVEARYITN